VPLFQHRNQPEKGAGDFKIVLLLPGPINDQSWNATNYAGLEKANATLGTKIEYIENVQAADFESTFRNYAERGYDLIMAAGTQFDEAANKVAKAQYPQHEIHGGQRDDEQRRERCADLPERI
jgi:basic membrane protein A